MAVWAFTSQSTADWATPFPNVAELGNVEADTLIYSVGKMRFAVLQQGNGRKRGLKSQS
jgi:hypothetical protein